MPPFRTRLTASIFTAALALQAGNIAAENPSVAEKIKALQRESLSVGHQHSVDRRMARNNKYENRNLYQYEDLSGNVTFTNRPEKYDASERYTRLNIEYQPITVPKQYVRRQKTAPVIYTSESVHDLVQHYARHYGMDPNLIYAVIKCESNFQQDAVSRAGACGLMQLMPGTAAEMGVTDIFDPAQNIAGGTQYLHKMLEIFKGDVRLALAGYNAGPEAVRRHGGIPPFKETQNYVVKVLEVWEGLGRSGGSTMVAQLTRRSPAGRAPAQVIDAKRFVVHFHSGLKQPADNVVDKDPYYYIDYGNRTYPVRKDLVKEVVEPA